MQPIKTLYLVNHTHTDIGFTDFQDNCFRQHAEFIEQALDLIEATADYPEEARYRWVCETTGPLERYASSRRSPRLCHGNLTRSRPRQHSRIGALDVIRLVLGVRLAQDQKQKQSTFLSHRLPPPVSVRLRESKSGRRCRTALHDTLLLDFIEQPIRNVRRPTSVAYPQAVLFALHRYSLWQVAF